VSAAAPYWIPTHVRACSAGAVTVLLDLKRNRYFGVGARETRALRTLAANWSDACTQTSDAIEPMASEEAARIADALENAGLMSRTAPLERLDSSRRVEVDGQLRDIGAAGRNVTIGARDALRFLRACLWARGSLRARPLFELACELSRCRSAAGSTFDETRAIELARIFRALRPYAFAAHDRCLFHALALVKFLSYHDVFPLWVIGVRVRPWAAHSWVQQGSLVLDGNPEQICQYTPIFAV
jgi:hypothetical protein